MSIRRAQRTPRQYSSDQIQVLEGLEPVRLRPGMYLGDLNEAAEGVFSAVLGPALNTVDPVRDDRILVTIHGDRSLTVEDFGTGLSVAPVGPRKKPFAVLFATTLHAGCACGCDGTRGVHDDGIGFAVANAVSCRLVMEVRTGGLCHRFVCRRGRVEIPMYEAECALPATRTGTKIHLRLDDDVLPPDVRFDEAIVRYHCERFAILRPGLRFHVLDERVGRTFEVYRPRGVLDALAEQRPLAAPRLVEIERGSEADGDAYRLIAALGRTEHPGVRFYSNDAGLHRDHTRIAEALETRLRADVGAAVLLVTKGHHGHARGVDVPRLVASHLPRGALRRRTRM